MKRATKQFREDMEFFISQELTDLLHTNIPDFANELAVVVSDIVLYDVALDELKRWREGYHNTLDEATDEIERLCQGESLQKRLIESPALHDVLARWLHTMVVPAINRELSQRCQRHNLEVDAEGIELSPSDVQIGTVLLPDGVPAQTVDSMLMPGDLVAAISIVVATTVTFLCTGTILTVIVSVIGAVSTAVATYIAGVIALNPLLWALLPAGVVAYTMAGGWSAIREDLTKAISSKRIPIRARKLIGVNRLESMLKSKEDEMRMELAESLADRQHASALTERASEYLAPQIRMRVDEICRIKRS